MSCCGDGQNSCGPSKTKENTELDSVKEYYGQILGSAKDLKTTACSATIPDKIKERIKEIHPEILSKFYGCGSPFPEALEGITVLDLGSGTGRDVYVLSKMVGETGKVIGLDMTDELLDVANKYLDYHAEKFGYKSSNVTFVKGYIEDLVGAGLAENSVDLVVSNCVINLSPAKDKVFSEIFRVLKPGGEMFISDIFSDRRIPLELRQDQELLGEGLSGAMYIEDFRRCMLKIGINDYRVISRRKIDIMNESVENKLGAANFYSITVRAFKLLELEDRCEDYGQVAFYLGTISENPNWFDLDDHHRFFKGKPMLVCSNTAMMLSETRFKSHFKIIGDLSIHHGLFPCDDPKTENTDSSSTGCN